MKTVSCTVPLLFQPDEATQRVRIGSQYDGGYVFSAGLIKPGAQILTFGLGENWDFENAFQAMSPTSAVDCYDHTVSGQHFRKLFWKSVLRYPNKTKKRREKIAVARSYDRTFSKNGFARHFEMEVGLIDSTTASRVDTAFGRLPLSQNNIILKCDIEGGEYAIIDDVVAQADRCAGVAMEFHDCWLHRADILRFMKTMKRTHRIDHFAVNNTSKLNEAGIPQYIELTFSRLDVPQDTATLPNGLTPTTDWGSLSTPNDPTKPMFVVSFDDEVCKAAWTD